MQSIDQEQLGLITRALISIFQNFIKIEATQEHHLKPLKEMIIEAANSLIKFFVAKADVFSLEQSFLGVLL